MLFGSRTGLNRSSSCCCVRSLEDRPFVLEVIRVNPYTKIYLKIDYSKLKQITKRLQYNDNAVTWL